MHRALRRAWQLGLLALVVAGVLSASASAADRAGYIVRLKAPPLAGYTGGTSGFAPTSPRVTGQRLTRSAPAVVAYRDHLAHLQDAVLRRLGSRAPDAVYSYRYAFAGFAARLDGAQLAQLRHDPDVASVEKGQIRGVTATTGPQADALLGGKTGDGASYLGLPTGLWQRLGGVDHAGEGVKVGVLDTGITPEHPSFADNGKGYIGPAYQPPAVWDGACQAGDGFRVTDCNNKLIGARYFVQGFGVDDLADDAFVSPRDDDGHGSHTASTAAGNFGVDPVIDGNDLGVDRISGIAPRAYVAMYKVCWPGGTVPDGCSTLDIVDAVDTAVADGVDVINFSIGSPTNRVLESDGLAFLGASDAGVYVATSAGNDGPADSTVGSPTGVPWVTSVAAATLSRTFEATATITKGSTTVTVKGASVTNALPAAPLVDAAASAAPGVSAASAELCRPGTLDPAKVGGKVVLCKRGINARVDKSKVVKDAGGVGMILYNVSDAQELVTDTHWVPSVHINNTDGLKVKALAGDGATAALTAGKATPLARGGVLAAFSSRGPQRSVPDLPKPDVTAPGVNILAAASPFPSAHTSLRPGQLFQSISGTSMASPHVAGAAALLTQLHPTWSPAAIKSSLMTSADPDVLLEDGKTAAGPFAAGSGEIAPNAAADPGLILDAGTGDYLGYLKGQKAQCTAELGVGCLEAIGFSDAEIASIREVAATDLNLPAISNSKVVGTLRTSRTFTSVDGTAQRWVVTVEGLPGIDAVPSPRRFTITPGQAQKVDFSFTVGSAPPDRYTSGAVVLRNGTRTVRLPVSLKPTAVSAPERVAVDATTADGSTPLTGVRSGFSGPFSAVGWGLAAPQVKAGEMITGSSEAPDLSGTDPGTKLYDATVPDGAQLFAARITNADGGAQGTDLDLYVYRDADGDGTFDPVDELVGVSGTSGSDESVELPLPDAGRYLIAVVGFAIRPGGSTFDLTQWLAADPQPDDPAPAPGLTITGDPVSATPGGAVPLTLNWSGVTEPGTYLGLATYHQGATPTAANRRAYSIVELHRGAGTAPVAGTAEPVAAGQGPAAAGAPPAAGGDAPSPADAPAAVAPSLVSGAAAAPKVALRALRLRGRVLVVTLAARAPTPLRVTVRRQARTVAKASARTGARSVTVRMARRLARGTYTVRVSATANGRTVSATRSLRIR